MFEHAKGTEFPGAFLGGNCFALLYWDEANFDRDPFALQLLLMLSDLFPGAFQGCRLHAVCSIFVAFTVAKMPRDCEGVRQCSVHAPRFYFPQTKCYVWSNHP